MLRTAIRKTLNFFQSKKLALILIGLFTLTVIIAAIIPQPVFIEKEEYGLWKSNHPTFIAFSEKLGLTHIYTSWWFITILVLLFVNTLVCNLYRIPVVAKRTGKFDLQIDAEAIRGLRNTWEIKTKVSQRNIGKVVEKVLGERSYKITYAQGGRLIYATKGKYGLWGSLFFHLALLVVIFGAVISSAFTMRGRILLTEGQSLAEVHKSYFLIEESPLFKERHQAFQVRLDEFYPEYIGTQIKMPGSKLTIIDENNEIKKQTIYVNHPLYYKGAVIYQRNNYGFSPLLVISNKQGEEIWKAYIALAIRKEKGVVRHKDTITLPYEMKAQIELYQKKSFSLDSSTLRLQITKAGRQVFNGTLRLGDKVFFQNNYLSFTDVRRWTTFNISRDPGWPIILVGIWLAVFGFLARSLFIRKRFWFLSMKEKPGINLIVAGGKAESFMALFGQEFDKVREELDRELKFLTFER